MFVAVVVFFLLNQEDTPAAPQEGQVQLDENGQSIIGTVTPGDEGLSPSELDLNGNQFPEDGRGNG
ncbi:MAG: hypothetical protein M5U34_44240 [Chloroflexi bacterium]|nr:hypothetical protein [Chloroflexota bacterium]